MSLYNMLHGVNSGANILLSILDIDQESSKWNSGRFRDIFLNKDGTKILLYTRNGGGNREHYCYCKDCGWDSESKEKHITAGENCMCTGCIIEHHLPKHPNYLSDYDDEYDFTYATVEFSVPKKAQELCKLMATGKDPKSVGEKFQDTMAKMENMKPGDIKKDPRFKPTLEILEKIASEVSYEK